MPSYWGSDGQLVDGRFELTGSCVVDVSLLSNVSTVSNGTPFTVGGLRTLTFEVYGSSATRTIVFECASVSGVYYPCTGTKLNDLTTGSQTTTSGEIWQFDVTGLVSFRARTTVVTGGTVSVKGKAVA